jgi:hypothetical protein
MQHQKLFQDSNIPKSYLTQLEASLGTKNEIKRIRSSYYSSNNFQDTNKIKITESKNIGLSPKSDFL